MARRRVISTTGRFLFVDIVKTAGTSLGEVLADLGAVGKHHSIARELPRHPLNAGLESPLPDSVIDSYFKFTIVRDPFHRLASLYSYCQTAPINMLYARGGWEAMLADPALDRLPERALDRETYWPRDFETFVDWLLDHERYYSDWTLEKYIPMADWLRDREGRIRIDYLGRYERLQSDVDQILKTLGAPPAILPKTNTSDVGNKREALLQLAANQRLRDSVIAYYREDFDLFGYPVTSVVP
jgi:hypothetical protein